MSANDNRTGWRFLWRQIRLLAASLLVMAAMKTVPKSALSIQVAQAFKALADAIRKVA